jgi:hypothetical protein
MPNAKANLMVLVMLDSCMTLELANPTGLAARQ